MILKESASGRSCVRCLLTKSYRRAKFTGHLNNRGNMLYDSMNDNPTIYLYLFYPPFTQPE
ncbi:hypothetical protein SOMG_01795 [Schizosaccharomyces osmophilus]|uniref:Uncharacterized protein n=1 Tax=Schizosaccharomyces osmophilus TaxID=2545709 RepID=A0AAF0AVB4_9SCHI|nr:uncharacterized protein SOMG_01795 [Schizosaccharomyces osmophilus]WBW71779.1 hypothetical protein SOMG_01795 [Schizosaccharomyces osmophilus]